MDAIEHARELPVYGDWRPTSYDTAGMGLYDRRTWHVLPIRQTRDSGCLERSNFRTAVKSLETADPAGYEVHRFGHWGPGWVEVILIDPESEAAMRAAGEIACSLDGYPVLSDDDYGALEWETACEWWGRMTLRDRIHACARYGVSIFAARRDDIPEDPTGELVSYLARDY